MMEKKQYLGDSVYAETENGMIKLTTNNGLSDTNTIYLENFVAVELQKIIKEFLK